MLDAKLFSMLVNFFKDIADAIIPTLFILFQILGVTLPLLISMAYLVYAERRIIGAMQMRIGPNVVGPFGLFQPFADALKLILKEVVIPYKADWKLFLSAPIITFTVALICWAAIPLYGGVPIADINVGVFYLLAMSSLGVYGIIIAGWSSNSKYALLGAMRSTAQMISYEVCIGLTFLIIFMITGSLNLVEIVNKMHSAPIWVRILNLPMCIVFFIAILAETNRHPFDLPEAEAELVSGYNVEYSSMPFALFYLGEYLNMILSAGILSILFLGGWYPPFDIWFLYYIPPVVWLVLKISLILLLFICIRGALPRYRYDQLMRICWKQLMPTSVGFVIFAACLLRFLR